MATTIEIAVPDIGGSEGSVVEIHVAVGDAVAVDDPLVTLESEKASMDVPSPSAGEVVAIAVEVGDDVGEGAPLVTLAADGDEPAADAEPAPAPAEPAAAPEPSDAPPAPRDTAAKPAPDAPARSDRAGSVYASPAARRRAHDLGVEIATVAGSGRRGRVTTADVEAAASPGRAVSTAGGDSLGLAPWPQVDHARFGPVERVALTRIQRISGPYLARNWVRIPHVTHNDRADITELEAFRKQVNGEQSDVKVTMVALLIKASVAALRAFPRVNASLDGDELVLKRFYNVGFAADTPDGLVVPVIKDADRKGLLEVAGELAELSRVAREGRLQPSDMQGASFTISSLGGIGGTSFTPIVNAPEVAILGATRASVEPVWDGERFQPRLLLPLSLSYDHRAIDGAAAARFCAHLAALLADMRRVLL